MTAEFPGDYGSDRPIGEFDTGEPLAEATQSRLASFLREVLSRDPIPGLSLAVVSPDGEAYTDAFGSRDLPGNTPTTPNTLYGVGSVTKSVTAMAILQLAESGFVAIDDPVADYLDIELDANHDVDSDADAGGGDEKDEPDPITLHHLLTHTSGYPSLGVSEALITRRLRRGDPGLPLGDRDDFYAHIEGAAGERFASPGKRFAYCNSGYALIGDVIEEATGKPYAEYVADHVLEPLEMGRATFDDTEFARDEDSMTQYLEEDGELVPTSLPTRGVSEPAGGLLTSVRELGNYVRCFLNDGEFHGVQVLSPDHVSQMTGAFVDTPDGPYGYGLRTRSVCGRSLVGHSGSIAVSSAYVGFCDEESIGIAVAANSAPEYPLARLGEAVLAILLEKEPDEAVPFWRRRRLFEGLEGTYATYKGIKPAVVRRIGGTLSLSELGPLGDSTTTLIPEDLGTGPVEELDRVEFVSLSDAGEERPVEFRFDGDDVSLRIDRWRFEKVSDEVPAEPEPRS